MLSLGSNQGLRIGIAAGYGWALEHGYGFCGRVDADGQHPAVELVRLLERVRADECDVAVGSRFVSGKGYAPYRYRPSPARGSGPVCCAARWASCCGGRSATPRAASMP